MPQFEFLRFVKVQEFLVLSQFGFFSLVTFFLIVFHNLSFPVWSTFEFFALSQLEFSSFVTI